MELIMIDSVIMILVRNIHHPVILIQQKIKYQDQSPACSRQIVHISNLSDVGKFILMRTSITSPLTKFLCISENNVL